MFVNSNDGYLDSMIASALSDMEGMTVGSEDYKRAAESVKLLQEARKNSSSWIPKADTILLAASNLLGIGLILNYEKLGVVTSKAMMMLIKPKL